MVETPSASAAEHARSDAKWICRPERGSGPRRGAPGARRQRRSWKHGRHYSIRNFHLIRFTMVRIRVRLQPATTNSGCALAAARPAAPCPHADTRRHGPDPDPQQFRHAGFRPGGQRPHRPDGGHGRGQRPLDQRGRAGIGDQRHQAWQPRASRQAGDRRVHLRPAGRARRAVVRVWTRGRDSSPTKWPIPLAPENLLKSSGRGIFFMRSFMDDVTLRRATDGGMEVRMVKKLAASGA